MKSTKNMLTYYSIKANFNEKFKKLEARILKGDREALKEYDNLLVDYKKFTNEYLSI